MCVRGKGGEDMVSRGARETMTGVSVSQCGLIIACAFVYMCDGQIHPNVDFKALGSVLDPLAKRIAERWNMR